uniref:Uncharacterized protein n=1 Tax=Ascaris lumbricoides TaxID=6252 RepID=A0A0M3HY29_ASCLU
MSFDKNHQATTLKRGMNEHDCESGEQHSRSVNIPLDTQQTRQLALRITWATPVEARRIERPISCSSCGKGKREKQKHTDMETEKKISRGSLD